METCCRWLIAVLLAAAPSFAVDSNVLSVDAVPSGTCKTRTVEIVSGTVKGNAGEMYCCDGYVPGLSTGTWAECSPEGGTGTYYPALAKWGCVAGDATDQSECIQAVIDAAWDDGGGEVVLDRGDWCANIYLRTGVTLRGIDGSVAEGAARLIPFADDPVITVDPADNTVRASLKNLIVTTATDRTLCDGSTPSTSHGIEVTPSPTACSGAGCFVNGLTLQRVYVAGFGGKGIYVHANGIQSGFTDFVQNVTMREVTVVDSKANGMHLHGGLLEFHIEKLTMSRNADDGLVGEDTDASLLIDRTASTAPPQRIHIESSILNSTKMCQTVGGAGYPAGDYDVTTCPTNCVCEHTTTNSDGDLGVLVYIMGARQVVFQTTDFEESPNYIQIGNNDASATDRASNVSINNCSFSNDTDDTPDLGDSFIVTLEDVDGFEMVNNKVLNWGGAAGILVNTGENNHDRLARARWSLNDWDTAQEAISYNTDVTRSTIKAATPGDVWFYGASGDHLLVDTYSAAGTDDLDNIFDDDGDESALEHGTILYVSSRVNSRDIVVKDGTGNIELTEDADMSLDTADKVLTLRWNGANAVMKWEEVSRSDDTGIDADTFVTNLDAHDHVGGDGAEIQHGSLGGVGTSDHHTPTVDTGVTPTGSNNQVITDNGDGTITSEANLTFDAANDILKVVDDASPNGVWQVDVSSGEMKWGRNATAAPYLHTWAAGVQNKYRWRYGPSSVQMEAFGAGLDVADGEDLFIWYGSTGGSTEGDLIMTYGDLDLRRGTLSMGGSDASAGAIRIYDDTPTTAQYVDIEVGDITTNWNYILPTAPGAAGQSMAYAGSATPMTWVTPVSVSGGANELITHDGDGTVTSESNLTFDGTNFSFDGTNFDIEGEATRISRAGADAVLQFLDDTLPIFEMRYDEGDERMEVGEFGSSNIIMYPFLSGPYPAGKTFFSVAAEFDSTAEFDAASTFNAASEFNSTVQVDGTSDFNNFANFDARVQFNSGVGINTAKATSVGGLYFNRDGNVSADPFFVWMRDDVAAMQIRLDGDDGVCTLDQTIACNDDSPCNAANPGDVCSRKYCNLTRSIRCVDDVPCNAAEAGDTCVDSPAVNAVLNFTDGAATSGSSALGIWRDDPTGTFTDFILGVEGCVGLGDADTRSLIDQFLCADATGIWIEDDGDGVMDGTEQYINTIDPADASLIDWTQSGAGTIDVSNYDENCTFWQDGAPTCNSTNEVRGCRWVDNDNTAGGDTSVTYECVEIEGTYTWRRIGAGCVREATTAPTCNANWDRCWWRDTDAGTDMWGQATLPGTMYQCSYNANETAWQWAVKYEPIVSEGGVSYETMFANQYWARRNFVGRGFYIWDQAEADAGCGITREGSTGDMLLSCVDTASGEKLRLGDDSGYVYVGTGYETTGNIGFYFDALGSNDGQFYWDVGAGLMRWTGDAVQSGNMTFENSVTLGDNTANDFALNFDSDTDASITYAATATNPAITTSTDTRIEGQLWPDEDIQFVGASTDRTIRSVDSNDLQFHLYDSLGAATTEFRWVDGTASPTTLMSLDASQLTVESGVDLLIDSLYTCNLTTSASGLVTCGSITTGAPYWTSSSVGYLSNEVVVNSLASLNTAISASIADGAHTTDTTVAHGGSADELYTSDGAGGVVAETGLTFDGDTFTTTSAQTLGAVADVYVGANTLVTTTGSSSSSASNQTNALWLQVRGNDTGDGAYHGNMRGGFFDVQLDTTGNNNDAYELIGNWSLVGLNTETGDTGNTLNYMTGYKASQVFGTYANVTGNTAIGFHAAFPTSAPSGYVPSSTVGLLVEDTTNVASSYRNYAIRVYAQDGTDSGASDGNIVMDGGEWNTGHIVLDSAHLYADSSNHLRIKNGAPSSETSGKTVLHASGSTNWGPVFWSDGVSSSYDTGTEVCAAHGSLTCDQVVDVSAPAEPGTGPTCATDMTATGYFMSFCK